jgi:hypothetical protein
MLQVRSDRKGDTMGAIVIPSEYRKEVKNLWSITRFSGKSTLAEAETELEARKLYYQVASLVPELDPAKDPVTTVRSVACIAIKQHQQEDN